MYCCGVEKRRDRRGFFFNVWVALVWASRPGRQLCTVLATLRLRFSLSAVLVSADL